MIVYDSLSLNMYVLLSRTLCMGYFSSRKVRIWHPKCVSICARPKRSHYKAVTSQIAQKTRVLWLTRGFPEEKLLWSDSCAQDCKLQGKDSHNESMCVSFLKRKRIRERSGLICTVFDSVRIRFDPHYRAASRKSRSI